MSGPEEPVPDWRAELAREHGLSWRAQAVAPAEAAPEADGRAQSWVAELLREAGVGPGASKAAAAAAALVKPVKAWSSAAGFDPRQVPASFEAYRALLHRVADGPRDALARKLAREPYMRAGLAVWAEGGQAARQNVMREVFARVSAAMGEAYAFNPAPLGYEPVPIGVSGMYSESHRRVMLAPDALARGFDDLVDLIVHEQIHKLQHEWYLRTHWPSRWPLTLDQRALVYYWVREEPRYRQLAAQGLADIHEGRGDAAYRRIAREYHAYDVGEAVTAAVMRAARGPDSLGRRDG